MRMINADALSDRVNNSNDPPYMKLYIDALLASSPTEHFPIVYCKDCIHFFYDKENDSYGCECAYGMTAPMAMDFCSKGEGKYEHT